MTKNDVLSRQPAAQQVADVLRRWILQGQLPGGEHIRQEAIAKELGVSRIPVREALTVLEVEGLVRREKYKGTVVVEISLDDVRETYALRELLECYLLERALPHLDESCLRRAEDIARQSDHCENDDEWARLNWEFHRALYQPARLPLALQTLEQLLRRSDRYFRLQRARSPNLRDSSREQHMGIIARIRAGDHAGALAALKEHIHFNSAEITDVIRDSSLAAPGHG